jgi:exosome complex protein LRP1
VLITVFKDSIINHPFDVATSDMTSETQNLKLRLQSLSSAFSDLEDQLAPLFAQSLPETLVDLDPIQAAKLQTVLAYVVYDLIFSTYLCKCGLGLYDIGATVYLKTKGIDPKTHPVISELVGSNQTPLSLSR